MNLAALRRYRVPLAAGGVGLAALLGLRAHAKASAAGPSGATTTAQAAPTYDSTGNDLYNSIQPQLQSLQDQIAALGATPSSPLDNLGGGGGNLPLGGGPGLTPGQPTPSGVIAAESGGAVVQLAAGNPSVLPGGNQPGDWVWGDAKTGQPYVTATGEPTYDYTTGSWGQTLKAPLTPAQLAAQQASQAQKAALHAMPVSGHGPVVITPPVTQPAK